MCITIVVSQFLNLQLHVELKTLVLFDTQSLPCTRRRARVKHLGLPVGWLIRRLAFTEAHEGIGYKMTVLQK